MLNQLEPAPARLVGGYLACVLLVPLYVNLFPLWQLVSAHLPDTLLHLLPAMLVAGIMTPILKRGGTSLSGTTRRSLPLLSGVGLCCIALAIPDADLPAKRAHVPEYLLLSLAVRATMSMRLDGVPLLVCGAAFTAVLGIHDEFLQGLHPLRTYGLVDMSVNTLAGLGGSLVWHSIGIFGGSPMTDDAPPHSPLPVILFLSWLCAGLVAFAIAASWYRTWQVPSWTTAPLIGALVGFALWMDLFDHDWRHGLAALAAISLPITVYPFLTWSTTMIFY